MRTFFRLRRTNGPSSRRAVALVGALGLALAGCAANPDGRSAYFARMSGGEAVEQHLAGEALAQRKASMRRIRRDLASFLETLIQLQRHGKTGGEERFTRFAGPYVSDRVDPLVDTEGAVGHPELRPFQAELLLSKAVLLHHMGAGREVRQTITRLERDFEGVGSMLVLYPTGEAVTLDQGIALLRSQTGAL